MSEVLSAGDTVHVVCRRAFDGDVERHLLGETMYADAGVVRVDAYAFVYDAEYGAFVKRPRMDRLVALNDAMNVVTILPKTIDIESLDYKQDGVHLVLTNGSFELDLSEFAPTKR